jgi:DNA-binding XRE family transcriptional regulator
VRGAKGGVRREVTAYTQALAFRIAGVFGVTAEEVFKYEG